MSASADETRLSSGATVALADEIATLKRRLRVAENLILLLVDQAGGCVEVDVVTRTTELAGVVRLTNVIDLSLGTMTLELVPK